MIDFEALLKQALRCGILVADFWEMTPRETKMAIEAAIWRDERQQRQALSLAWHTAALSRAKRLPSLKRLLSTSSGSKARPLRGPELRKRRREYEEMAEGVDVEKLAGRLKKIPRKTSE